MEPGCFKDMMGSSSIHIDLSILLSKGTAKLFRFSPRRQRIMIWLTLLWAVSALILFSLLRNAFRPGLTDVPGPFLAKFSNLWRLYTTWRQTFKDDIPVLHRKYKSSLIRIGPNLVSCSDPRVIDSIYGFHNEMMKVGMLFSLFLLVE